MLMVSDKTFHSELSCFLSGCPEGCGDCIMIHCVQFIVITVISYSNLAFGEGKNYVFTHLHHLLCCTRVNQDSPYSI
jgi:hypothetical protein